MTDDVGFEVEIEHGHAEYTAEELLQQARANAQAAVIATVAFLHERGVPLEAWTDAIGRLFARAWGAPRAWDAAEFMDAMLTNFRSLGAEVVSVELGSERAEAVTTGFPDRELCDLFGVEPALAARFNDATALIAADRGLAWTWALEGDRTRYLATRLTAVVDA